jgi:hypothetical protein
VINADYVMSELNFVNGLDTELNATLATPPLSLVQLLIYEWDPTALDGDRSLTIQPEEWNRGQVFLLRAVPTASEEMRLTRFCMLSVSADPMYNGMRRCVELNLVPADQVVVDPDCPPVRWGCPPPRALPRSEIVHATEGGIATIGMGLSVAFTNTSDAFAEYNLTAPDSMEVVSQQLQDWDALACPPLFKLYNVMGMFLLDVSPPYASEAEVGLQWELPGGASAGAEEMDEEVSDYHFLIADDRCPPPDVDIRLLTPTQLIAACQNCDWYLHLASVEPAWAEVEDGDDKYDDEDGQSEADVSSEVTFSNPDAVDSNLQRRFATAYLESMPIRHLAIVKVRPTILLETTPAGAGRAMEYVENTPGVALLPPLSLGAVVAGRTPDLVRWFEVSIGGQPEGSNNTAAVQPSLALADVVLPVVEVFDWTWDPETSVLRIQRFDGKDAIMFQVEEALSRVRFQVRAILLS